MKSSATLARELRGVRAKAEKLRAEIDPAEAIVADLTTRLIAGRDVEHDLDLSRRALDQINGSIRHLDATAEVLDQQRRDALAREQQAEEVALLERVMAAVAELRRRAGIYSDDLQRATSSARKLALAAAAVREALPGPVWRDGKLGLPRVLGPIGLDSIARTEARRIGGSDPIPGIDPVRDFSVPLVPLADEIAAVEIVLRRALGDPEVPALPVAVRDPPRPLSEMGRLPDCLYGRDRRRLEDKQHEEALAGPMPHGVPLASRRPPVLNPWGN